MFVPKVCKAIYETLKEEYLKVLKTKEEWLELPVCISWKAHITFPSHGGASEYYKGFYHLFLMAIVDYDYRLIYADVGCPGGRSEGGLFRYKSFCKSLGNVQLNLLDTAPLPRNEDWDWEQGNMPVPFVFIGDNAFRLTTFCMKPYSQRDL